MKKERNFGIIFCKIFLIIIKGAFLTSAVFVLKENILKFSLEDTINVYTSFKFFILSLCIGFISQYYMKID